MIDTVQETNISLDLNWQELREGSKINNIF